MDVSWIYASSHAVHVRVYGLECSSMQLCRENLEHSSSGNMSHVILFGSYPAGL